MKYFKLINDKGDVIRYDACEINSCGGIEITEDEYIQATETITSGINDEIIQSIDFIIE